MRQQYDATLGRWVFAFDIHIDTDTNKGEEADRQRNELKTDNNSPASMVGKEGQTLENSWLFRLPEGMKTTTSFTHVHQSWHGRHQPARDYLYLPQHKLRARVPGNTRGTIVKR